MDVWDENQHQSQEIGWGFEQIDRKQTGARSISDFPAGDNWLKSLAAAQQGPLTGADGLPKDFDWRAYLAYYPDLSENGINSEVEAQRHYLKHGRREGRIHKRLRVVLHYTACTGLINQHYSHIAAFTLSSAIGAELVLAPGLQRDSFASYFSAHQEQNEVTWSSMSTSDLLDVDRIIEEWRAHGMYVHKVSAAGFSTMRFLLI